MATSSKTIMYWKYFFFLPFQNVSPPDYPTRPSYPIDIPDTIPENVLSLTLTCQVMLYRTTQSSMRLTYPYSVRTVLEVSVTDKQGN